MPRQLFKSRRDTVFNPYAFKYNLPQRYSKSENWTKIVVGRNPFNRLYSAWKDKSRTFRFENGTINWDKEFLKNCSIFIICIGGITWCDSHQSADCPSLVSKIKLLFQNSGKAIAETTWAWGTENMSDEERFRKLSETLKQHDKNFNAKVLGIDKYENGQVPYSRRFTWEALTKFIASSPVGNVKPQQQNHWQGSTGHNSSF